MFARRALDVLDDLLAKARLCFSCLSHVPLLSGYDEPETLSYQITLFGPIGPDVRQNQLVTNVLLLPLNRCRWLRRNIIGHSANATDLIDNTARDRGQ